MASGANALLRNTTGSGNTVNGAFAMEFNTTGGDNTATGHGALSSNTTGMGNTASGSGALYANMTGGGNVADGLEALGINTTGGGNTASGWLALYSNTTGSNNVALGCQAAAAVLGSNSNNIHIGTQGSLNDNGTIRIGGNAALGDPATQSQFFASGIYGATTGASGALPVVVDSNGQLGTTSSSRTVKSDIEDMGDTTDTLMSLRPVRFRYKVYGPDSPLQYGLVAEEVAEVAPELVARDKDGKIETVFYDKVNAMLLNQVQTQQRLIEEQREQLQSQRQDLSDRLQAQDDFIRRLESRLAELENRAK
jgi:polyhydroxyalkanoate synthesis regulator phasin